MKKLAFVAGLITGGLVCLFAVSWRLDRAFRGILWF